MNDTTKYFGNWVKVKFNNTIGYVLDSYLFYVSEVERRFDLNENKNYILLATGYGCSPENIYDPSEWHLYGYYFNEDNTYEVKKLTINYLSTKEYTCDLLITLSQPEGLKFIIGNKHPISIQNGLILCEEIFYSFENAPFELKV